MCACWSRPLVLKFRTKPPASLTAVIYSAGRFCCIIATAGKPAESAGVTRFKAWILLIYSPFSHKAFPPCYAGVSCCVTSFPAAAGVDDAFPFPSEKAQRGNTFSCTFCSFAPPNHTIFLFYLPPQLSVCAIGPLITMESTVPCRLSCTFDRPDSGVLLAQTWPGPMASPEISSPWLFY